VPAALVSVLLAAAAFADDLEKDRRRGAEMLRQVAGLLERRYHDPTFGGVPLAARLARAEAEMRTASSERATYGVVARLLAGLADSHTFFVPPAPAGAVDYGWTPRMMGERCLVADVAEDTDAAARGVRTGDEVLAVEGVRPDRANLWTTLHLARLLRPRPDVELTLRGADGTVRTLPVVARDLAAGQAIAFDDYLSSLRQKLRARVSSRFASAGPVLVWRLSSFDKRGRAIQEGIARARRHRGLVLDLRGNAGGDDRALRRLAGRLLPGAEPVTIGWLRSRSGSRAITAERWNPSRGFPGPLVVVVDSESASASEVFARMVQLHRRGTVVGDRTAGAVGMARVHVILGTRGDRFVPYGVSVTEAALEMPGGARLEKIGVTPDQPVVPTPEDLRAGRDPALSRAVFLAGGSLDAEAAGRLFTGPPPGP
jgi:carboxyl-terminal processing protease